MASEAERVSLPTLCSGRYQLNQKVCTGSFGEIFLGVDTQAGEEVAVKLEPLSVSRPQLAVEVEMYRSVGSAFGFPAVRWSGMAGSYTVVVMDLLGPSLEDLFDCCGRTFDLKTVLMVADQMLKRVEVLHSKGIVHRDIKPDNFLIGQGKWANHVHIVDLCLAKRFCDPVTQQHLHYREGKAFVGTAPFASVRAHLGVEQSRRDDLEAIGYVLVYLLRGSLPWQGLTTGKPGQRKYERLLEKKLSIPLEDLTRGYPDEFRNFLGYCRTLDFTARPEYRNLRRQFQKLFLRNGYAYDFVYAWTPEIQSSMQTMDGRPETSDTEPACTSCTPIAHGLHVLKVSDGLHTGAKLVPKVAAGLAL